MCLTDFPRRCGWLGAVGALLLAWPAHAGFKAGDSLPDLAAFQLEGKLPDPLKGRIILLDFWASWCAPCKLSFRVMEELHQKYAAQGLVILAVNVDEHRADMEKFLKRNPVSFPIVRDATQKLVKAADAETMPSSFLVDRAGRIRFTHSGFHESATRKQYLEQIELLLKADAR